MKTKRFFTTLAIRLMVVAAIATMMVGTPIGTTAAPAATGGISGTITGLRVCNAPGGPLEEATINVTGSGGYSNTLHSDGAGIYTLSLDASTSPLTLAVSHSGYVTQSVSGISVTAGVTTTQNFTLHTDAPCLAPVPGAVQSSQFRGAVVVKTLELGNTGASPLTWSVAERLQAPTKAGPTATGIDLINDGGFEDYTANPYWQEYSTTYGTPNCSVDACGGSFAHGGTHWVDFGGTGGPEHGTITQTLRIPSGTASLSYWVWLSNTTGYVTDTLRLVVDGHQLWTTDAGSAAYSAGYSQVTVDLSAYADGALHAIVFDSHTDDPTTVTGTSFKLDDVALMSGPLPCAGDIPWLSIPTTAGTVPSGSTGAVTLRFDSTALQAGSTYTGTVCLTSDDPTNTIVAVPVSLLVGKQQTFLPVVRNAR